MCGILAYYKEDGITRNDLKVLISAVDSMQHRGPDGAGVMLFNIHNKQHWRLAVQDHPDDVPIDLRPENYKDCSANIFLGHRRLSIFDISSRGHQPMRDNAGNCIIFNGAVYNFIELRAELKQLGIQFHTDTDTEVILAAYRCWGVGCLKRFVGMWSFLLYDVANNLVFVSNDRFGIKPMYFYSSSNYWIYASEIKAIRKAVNDKLEYHLENIRIFVNEGLIDFDETTLYKNMFRFKPANYQLNFPNNLPNAEFQPYWQFPQHIKNYSSIEAAAVEFRELFTDAVRLRMRSDVPWGTTLSGGLDSSSIVYTANELLKTKGNKNLIHTFSAIFPGQEGDESEYIRYIQTHLKCKSAYVCPLDEFARDDFEFFLKSQDLPTNSTSFYAQWCVMRLAKQSSVKVLLDGQGGDELFAGYHHHFYRFCKDLVLKGRIGRYLHEVKAYAHLKKIRESHIHKFILGDLKSLVQIKLGLISKDHMKAIYRLTDSLKMDLISTQLPVLLRNEDHNSMAFGLESRVPFLDHRLVEFAFTLPDKFKIYNGWQKYIMRNAMDILPNKIRYRKDKNGFNSPENYWIKKYYDLFYSFANSIQSKSITLQEVNYNDSWDLHKISFDKLFRLANLGAWM